MRKVPLTVSIPQPCRQPWEDMTPEAHGRFCGNCQKSVIDFSDLSDSEILALLSDTSKKYCGRFKKSQLDRLVLPEQQATSLLPAAVLGLMLAAGIPAVASATDNRPQYVSRDTTTSRILTGKVTDINGSIVPAVTVSIKGTNRGVLTDANGHYQLTVVPSQQVVLVFSYIGYERLEVPVTAQPIVDVVLKPDETRLLGDVVVAGGVRVVKATPWQRLKHGWQRLWHR